MCKKVLISLTSEPHPDMYNILFAVDNGYDFVLPITDINQDNIKTVVTEVAFSRENSCINKTVFFLNITSDQIIDTFIKLMKTLKTKNKLQLSAIIDPGGAYTTASAIIIKLFEASKYINIQLKDCKVAVIGGAGRVGRSLITLLTKKCKKITIIDKNKEHLIELVDKLNRTGNKNKTEIEYIVADKKTQYLEKIKKMEIIITTGPPQTQFLTLGEIDAKIAIDVNPIAPYGIEGIYPRDDSISKNGIFCYGCLAIGKLKREIQKQILRLAIERSGQIFDLKNIFRAAKNYQSLY